MSAVTCSFALELGLSALFDGGGFDATFFETGAANDLHDDVIRTQPIVCRYGISGTTPNDRIADTGTLSVLLDNSANNSAGLVGYYSPLNANCRTGFDYNKPVRWSLTSGGTTAYKFFGHLDTITPVAGTHGQRVTQIQAVDWMDQAAEVDLPDLDVQINQRGDQIVSLILDSLGTADQPAARDIETSLDTYPMALDGGTTKTDAKPKVREILNQLALSGYEYGYIKGDTVTGGVFAWENRQHRVLNQTPSITLTDSDEVALLVPGNRGDIYSTIQIFVSPTNVDEFPTTVLFSLQTTSTLVSPGDTDTTLFGAYRDPNTNESCGGTDLQALVAGVDYTMNAASDGTGTDLTSAFVVTPTFTGLGVNWAITNTGTVPGYVTTLQATGKAIRRYSAVVEVAVNNSYGSRVFQMSMPYQSDTNVAADVANYLKSILGAPFAHVSGVTFLANRSSTLMSAALLLEPGDRVAVSETVTGVNDSFTINSVQLSYESDTRLWCTWGLEPAVVTTLWQWGVAGYSEWGTTSVYGW